MHGGGEDGQRGAGQLPFAAAPLGRRHDDAVERHEQQAGEGERPRRPQGVQTVAGAGQQLVGFAAVLQAVQQRHHAAERGVVGPGHGLAPATPGREPALALVAALMRRSGA